MRQSRASHSHQTTCALCDGPALDNDAYAYLLGAYLGDGRITTHKRGVYRLTVFCDLLYLDLAREIARAMEAVRR